MKQDTRSFKQMIYNNMGFMPTEKPQEDSERPLMFERTYMLIS